MADKKNIRIEEISDINFEYPYLEVFYGNSNQPFLDIGITSNKELNFRFYHSCMDINLSITEIDYIVNLAKEFLGKTLKNEEDFLKWINE